MLGQPLNSVTSTKPDFELPPITKGKMIRDLSIGDQNFLDRANNSSNYKFDNDEIRHEFQN